MWFDLEPYLKCNSVLLKVDLRKLCGHSSAYQYGRKSSILFLNDKSYLKVLWYEVFKCLVDFNE